MALSGSHSSEEIKKIIYEHLDDMGVSRENMQISIVNGSKVVLRGEILHESQREELKDFISDMAGIDNIVDELIVIHDEYEEGEGEELSDEEELYDEDKEKYGTGDIFRSVEDGVPYVPPTSPPYEESKKKERKRKRKKKPR